MNKTEFKQLNIDVITKLYPEEEYNPEVTELQYEEKILKGEKGKENLKYLKEMFLSGNSGHPSLLVAPCSAGKTYTINQIADELIQEDIYDTYVFVLFPGRSQCLQVANEYAGFEAIIAGKQITERKHKCAVVYEKVSEVGWFLNSKKYDNENLRAYVIVDEAQELVKARNYRESVKNIQALIHSDLCSFSLCMTGTPTPVSCFLYDQLLFMTDQEVRSKIGEIDILQAEDCDNTIYQTVLSAKAPYARINDLDEIGRMRQFLEKNGNIVEILTSEEKGKVMVEEEGRRKEVHKNKTLQNIIEKNSLSNETFPEKILCSSLLDAGVNFTEYSKETIPIYYAPRTIHMCADDVIQFISRFRNGLEKALIVLPITGEEKKGRKKAKFKELPDLLQEVVRLADKRVEQIKKTYDAMINAGLKDAKLGEMVRNLLIINEYDYDQSMDHYYTIQRMDEEGLDIAIEPENLFLIAYQRFNAQYYSEPENLIELLKAEFQTEVAISLAEKVPLATPSKVKKDSLDISKYFLMLSFMNSYASFQTDFMDKKWTTFLRYLYIVEDGVKLYEDDKNEVSQVYQCLVGLMDLGLSVEEAVGCLLTCPSQREYDRVVKKLQLAVFLETLKTSSSTYSSQFAEYKYVYLAVESIKRRKGQKGIALNKENYEEIQQYIRDTYHKELGIIKIRNRIEEIYVLKNKGVKGRNPSTDKIKTLHYVARKICEDYKNEEGPLRASA